jgi:hypothetical protein
MYTYIKECSLFTVTVYSTYLGNMSVKSQTQISVYPGPMLMIYQPVFPPSVVGASPWHPLCGKSCPIFQFNIVSQYGGLSLFGLVGDPMDISVLSNTITKLHFMAIPLI